MPRPFDNSCYQLFPSRGPQSGPSVFRRRVLVFSQGAFQLPQGGILHSALRISAGAIIICGSSANRLRIGQTKVELLNPLVPTPSVSPSQWAMDSPRHIPSNPPTACACDHRDGSCDCSFESQLNRLGQDRQESNTWGCRPCRTEGLRVEHQREFSGSLPRFATPTKHENA
jgi:hypothetical protein